MKEQSQDERQKGQANNLKMHRPLNQLGSHQSWFSTSSADQESHSVSNPSIAAPIVTLVGMGTTPGDERVLIKAAKWCGIVMASRETSTLPSSAAN